MQKQTGDRDGGGNGDNGNSSKHKQQNSMHTAQERNYTFRRNQCMKSSFFQFHIRIYFGSQVLFYNIVCDNLPQSLM